MIKKKKTMKKSKLKILLIVVFLLCSCASSGNKHWVTINPKGIQTTVKYAKNMNVKTGANKEVCIDVSEFCEKKPIKVFTIGKDSTFCSCTYFEEKRFLLKKLLKNLK